MKARHPLVRDRRRTVRYESHKAHRKARQDGGERRTYHGQSTGSYHITFITMKTLELPLSYWAIPYYSFPHRYENSEDYQTFAEYETKQLKTKAPLTVAIGNYATGSYEWYWVLFAKDTNGNWYKWDCGHCSCYWPLERWESGIFTQDEVEKLMEEYPDILEYAKENLFNK